MSKVTLPFGEWRPDVAVLDNEFALIAENVFPSVNSYLPFQDLSAQTAVAISDGGNDSFTKVLLQFDGADASTTITDSNIGGSAHTWTANGNAQLDTAIFKFGTAALLCDGTGDYVSTSDHANFTLGSGAFSVDMWAAIAGADGVQLNLCGQGDSTPSAATSTFWILRNSSNKIEANVSNGSAYTTLTSATSFTIAATTFHHIELTRSGNTIYLFVNGVLEDSDTFSGTVPDSTNDLSVGRMGEVTTTTWNGSIDAFRLSVGVARHTAAFTTITGAYYNGINQKCRGITVARKLAGQYVVYIGTANLLLRWSGEAWGNVSKSANYAIDSGRTWVFQQSGTKLVAVSGNLITPQVIDVDSGVVFADLAGSPPTGISVAQIGDFLVIAGANSSTVTRLLQWSAINDITGWTDGVNLSGSQEFPDGGDLVGVVGGEIGYIVQERAIRLMQFLPGDPTTVFAFSKVVDNKGCISRYGFTTIAGTLFFIAEDGFYSLAGQDLQAIGAFKINNWFLENSEPTRRDEVLAFLFPNKTRVCWAFYAVGTTSVTAPYDRVLIYDWVLQKWSYSTKSAQIWGTVHDTVIPTVDDRLVMGGIDSNGLLSVQDGTPIAATIDTSERHLIPGMRAFVNEAYPIVDNASGVTVTMGTRENLQTAVAFGSAVSLETTGAAPVLSSSRLYRARVSIPAGTWTHAQGVLVDAQQDGQA